jgi:hypothetical protein
MNKRNELSFRSHITLFVNIGRQINLVIYLVNMKERERESLLIIL